MDFFRKFGKSKSKHRKNKQKMKFTLTILLLINFSCNENKFQHISIVIGQGENPINPVTAFVITDSSIIYRFEKKDNEVEILKTRYSGLSFKDSNRFLAEIIEHNEEHKSIIDDGQYIEITASINSKLICKEFEVGNLERKTYDELINFVNKLEEHDFEKTNDEPKLKSTLLYKKTPVPPKY